MVSDSEICVVGGNSKLFSEIKSSLGKVTLLGRYEDYVSEKELCFVIFSDVPSISCAEFVRWLEELDSKNDVKSFIFCSSFVCQYSSVSQYQVRKTIIEKLMKEKFGAKAVCLRLKNLVFKGSQWEYFILNLRKKIVFNFSVHSVAFQYMTKDQIIKTLCEAVSSMDTVVADFSTVDIRYNASHYFTMPFFKSPPYKASRIVRAINKYTPFLIICGTEYSYYED